MYIRDGSVFFICISFPVRWAFTEHKSLAVLGSFVRVRECSFFFYLFISALHSAFWKLFFILLWRPSRWHNSISDGEMETASGEKGRGVGVVLYQMVRNMLQKEPEIS